MRILTLESKMKCSSCFFCVTRQKASEPSGWNICLIVTLKANHLLELFEINSHCFSFTYHKT